MVYIRTDANNLVATGHIMRCITIAKKIKTFNEDVVFIVKDDDTVKMIGGKFKYYRLPSHEITDIYNEIPFIREIVANDKNAKILLDLYIFDATYMSLIKSFSKVITFDDIFKEFFPVDMIINYNPHYYIYDYQTRYHNWAGKLLLGESYVPLREMFENACSDENEKVKNIIHNKSRLYRRLVNAFPNIKEKVQFKKWTLKEKLEDIKRQIKKEA